MSKFTDAKVNDLVRAWADYIGLEKNLHVEEGHNFILSPINYNMRVIMKFDFERSPLEDSFQNLRSEMEKVENQILGSKLVKTIIQEKEAVQKELEAAKAKLAELEKFKNYYELQMQLNHGSAK